MTALAGPSEPPQRGDPVSEDRSDLTNHPTDPTEDRPLPPPDAGLSELLRLIGEQRLYEQRRARLLWRLAILTAVLVTVLAALGITAVIL